MLCRGLVDLDTMAVSNVDRQSRKHERGSALIEFAFLFPMLFFLFLGVFDMGYFSYALIATTDAARAAALYTSTSSTTSSDSAGACTRVLMEFQAMPNASLVPSSCNASPLQVTAQSITGPDGNPASQVTVIYQTIQLVPIPGLPGKWNFKRVATMRIKT